MPSYVYILASQTAGTVYVGVTTALAKRMSEHKQGKYGGFSKKYGIKKLVYYEVHEEITAAITREKQIKEWKRAWKIRLIEEKNPHWNDLFEEIAG